MRPPRKVSTLNGSQTEPAIVRLLLVARESQLPVGADRLKPPCRGKHPFDQEAADTVQPVKPGWQWRHRESDIVGEQRHDRVHIGACLRANERVDHRTLSL